MEGKQSISAAESLTGGLFQAELVKVPGISEVFAGGIVSYQENAKQKVLGVPEHILETYGMVSAECAVAMAERARELFDTQLAISFTGVAGPDPTGEQASRDGMDCFKPKKWTDCCPKASNFSAIALGTGNRQSCRGLI